MPVRAAAVLNQAVRRSILNSIAQFPAYPITRFPNYSIKLSPVKITDFRVTVVGAPWRELVFVELTTDAGLTGVSECRMVNKTATLLACVRELAPRYVIGSDPF